MDVAIIKSQKDPIFMEALERKIENYSNPYYDENVVERVIWLLWDNVEFYHELEVIDDV